jgi:hypothetical protein
VELLLQSLKASAAVIKTTAKRCLCIVGDLQIA